MGTQALYSVEVSAGGKYLGPSAALTSAFMAQLGVRTSREAPRACAESPSVESPGELPGGGGEGRRVSLLGSQQ